MRTKSSLAGQHGSRLTMEKPNSLRASTKKHVRSSELRRRVKGWLRKRFCMIVKKHSMPQDFPSFPPFEAVWMNGCSLEGMYFKSRSEDVKPVESHLINSSPTSDSEK